MKEKLVYISNARIIGILLVVFGHSYPFAGEIPKALDTVRNFLYCFHMPLFVFISGYLVSKTGSVKKYGPQQYIQKRFVKLFVPYFCLSALGFLPKILMSGFINDEVEFSFTYFIRTLLVPRENVWGHFWFIPMLFVMAVVSVIYTKGVQKNRQLGIIVCVLSFGLIFMPSITDWLGINDIKNYLFWYLSGLVIGDTGVFERFKSVVTGMICLACGLFVFILCGTRAYNAFVALFMIVGIILLCMYIDLENIKILNTIGKYSFPIFLLSWPAQVVVEVVGNRILHLPLVINVTMMFLSGVVVPLIIVWIVKRLKNIPCMNKIQVILGM